VWPAEILIDAAGRHHVLRTRPHKGSPHNPFTWDEACEKFRRYTRSILTEQQAKTIITAIADLEQVADTADIATLMAVP
jgi:2-methylcitrate dehydratase PrpD